MIPVQDVVPSGRVPLATLVLIALNVLAFVLEQTAGLHLALLQHAGIPALFVTVIFLWLFGDNVEARLGRAVFVATYVACGAVAAYGPGLTTELDVPRGLGAAAAVTGVLGAYFVLLPHARVLMFVPAPPFLIEAPALFFLGIWWLLQFLTFVVAPGTVRLQPGGGGAMWALALALLLGAVAGRLARRPIVWD